MEKPWLWAISGAVLTILWMLGDTSGLSWIEFPLDDGWIHLVYVRSIATVGWPEYNPGQAETGMSSLLWVLINVPFYMIGQVLQLSPAVMPKILSGTCAGLCAWRLYTVSDDVHTTWKWLLPLLLLLNPHWLFSAASGMEVTLTAFLWLQTLHTRNKPHAAFWCALSVLCRLESLFLWATLVLIGLVNRHSFRQIAMNLLLPIGLLSLWLVYNYGVSGHLLPATFAVKGQTESIIRPDNIKSVVEYFWNHMGPIGLFSIGLGLTQLKSKHPQFTWAIYMLGLVCVMSITHTFSQSEYFYWSRYLHPILPVGVALCVPLLTSRYRSLLLLWVGWNLYTLPSVHQLFVANVEDIHHMDTLVGQKLQAQNQDGWIASTNAGSVRFHSNRPVIDILGLNAHELAHDENPSQRLLELLDINDVQTYLLFASEDSARLVDFLNLELVEVIERPKLSLCECPSQKSLGIFQKRP
ncbi:MAG: hypothetical protein ACON4U_13125 [Myxococcota bacterium]